MNPSEPISPSSSHEATDFTSPAADFDELGHLIGQTPVGIAFLNSQARFVYCNQELLRLFGQSWVALKDQPLTRLVPSQYGAIVQEALANIEKAGHTSRINLDGLHADDHTFPIDLGITRIQTPQGVRYACVITDLSFQLGAEQALADSEQRFQQLIDNTTAVIYLKDTELRYLYVNHQFEQLFNFKRDELAGRNDLELFDHDIAVAFQKNDRQVLESRRTIKFDEVAPHKDGLHNYVSVKFPVHDTRGEIYGVAGVSTDITERVVMERETVALKERLRLILDSIQDGIVGCDERQRVNFLNQTAAKLLGLSMDQARKFFPKWIQSLPTRRQSPNLGEREPDEELAGNHQPFSGTAMTQRIDGTVFPIEFVSSPIENHNQEIGQVIAFRDISDRLQRQAIEREIETARALQQLLLPRQAPNLPGMQIQGAVFPATQTCGDYLDFIPLDNHRELVIAIGDVSGHGFGPAMHMVETRAYLRGILQAERDMGAALDQLNNLLVPDTLDYTFITLFLCRIDPRRRLLQYASAGQEGWLLPANAPPQTLESTGIVLGIEAHAAFQTQDSIKLNPGDLVLVATDGVFETMSPRQEIFGVERMLEIAHKHRSHPALEIADAIWTECRAFANHNQLKDDVTILIIKVDEE